MKTPEVENPLEEWSLKKSDISLPTPLTSASDNRDKERDGRTCAVVEIKMNRCEDIAR